VTAEDDRPRLPAGPAAVAASPPAVRSPVSATAPTSRPQAPFPSVGTTVRRDDAPHDDAPHDDEDQDGDHDDELEHRGMSKKERKKLRKLQQRERRNALD
jgi:hypothetical protein